MERHNEQVKRVVPAERLLVWEVGEGWEPLCEFLEVDVPDEPLPHANDRGTFLERVIGGALDALQGWRESTRRSRAEAAAVAVDAAVAAADRSRAEGPDLPLGARRTSVCSATRARPAASSMRVSVCSVARRPTSSSATIPSSSSP